MRPNTVADTGNTCLIFHFLARSDKHFSVCVIYFLLPHTCRKLWG